MHLHMRPIPLQQTPASVRELPKPITPYTSGVQRVTDRQGGGAGRENSQSRQRRETRRNDGQLFENAGHNPTATLATALALFDLGDKAEQHIPDMPMSGESSLNDLLSGAVSAGEDRPR